MTAPRRPRRAVRPSGAVGTDESVLRSRVPAPPATPTPPGTPGGDGAGSPGGDGAGSPGGEDRARPARSAAASAPLDDLWRVTRSADDTDQGWGDPAVASGEDPLLREKPPHW